MLRQFRQRDMRQLPIPAQVQAGIELHQIYIAALVLGQQNNRRRRLWPLTGGGRYIGQINLTAHDRLNPRRRGGYRKLKRREHVVGIGHGDRRHPCIAAQAGQFLQPHSAFQQGIFAMHTQVNESGVFAHAATLKPFAANEDAKIDLRGLCFFPRDSTAHRQGRFLALLWA